MPVCIPLAELADVNLAAAVPSVNPVGSFVIEPVHGPHPSGYVPDHAENAPLTFSDEPSSDEYTDAYGIFVVLVFQSAPTVAPFCARQIYMLFAAHVPVDPAGPFT